LEVFSYNIMLSIYNNVTYVIGQILLFRLMLSLHKNTKLIFLKKNCKIKIFLFLVKFFIKLAADAYDFGYPLKEAK